MGLPITSVVPMAFVAEVERSVGFYETLGFAVRNRVLGEDGKLQWAWLGAGSGANLMLARASEPVVADAQAVLFYVYTPDVAAKHAELAASGLVVSAITTPFYAPRGEFRVVDPDGYALMITHSD